MNLKRILLLTGVFFVLTIGFPKQIFAEVPSLDECTTNTDCRKGGDKDEYMFCNKGYCVYRPPSTGGIKEFDNYQEGNQSDLVNSSKYVGNAFKDTMSALFFSVAGETDPETGEVSGLIPSLGNYIAIMYSAPPAQTEVYIADVMNSANIATPAYAQGLGFSALTPVLDTWKAFRDIAYFFFIIFFLVVGFMIMFRQKVGQTAVTAQQALPKIVVSMIAVTFSYAIAGFLIDLMYVFMFLIVSVFDEGSEIINQSIFEIGKSFLVGDLSIIGSTYDAVSTFVDQAVKITIAGEGLGIFAGFSAAVVIALAMAFAIFGLFFELLKTYVSIIISIVTAPLLLMFGAIPGQNTFSKWIKSLIGNLAAFPILLIILIIYKKVTSFGAGASGDNMFLPPFMIGQGNGEAIVVMFGIGIALVAKKIVQDGKKAMGASGGFFDQYAQAAGDQLKKGWNGGELIPGIAATDTSKWPMGGLTGKNVARKGAIGIGGTAGLITGVPGNIINRRILNKTQRGKAEGSFYGMVNTARNVGSLLGDKEIKRPEKKKD